MRKSDDDIIDAADEVDLIVNPVNSVNKVPTPRHAMNEAEIRAEHIDPALKAADWGGKCNKLSP